MPQRNPEAEARANFDRLAGNDYPGRLIVQGLSDTAQFAVQVYALTGRSAGSKNRVFRQEPDNGSATRGDLVRTVYPEGFVPPEGTNTSETIYNALRTFGDTHVVTNGKQTDTIIEGFQHGRTLEDSLAKETFESPESDYTPRISGVMDLSQPNNPQAVLSLIHRDPATGKALRPLFPQNLTPGFGETIHTYYGDGKPLPTFDSAPYSVPLNGDIDEILETYRGVLPEDKLAAITIKTVDLETKEEDFRIFNTINQEEAA